jgi:hypothetical protein
MIDLNLNTVLAGLNWELIEPEEGHFDRLDFRRRLGISRSVQAENARPRTSQHRLC